jgi:ribosomal-protein-serine acetyltransferase
MLPDVPTLDPKARYTSSLLLRPFRRRDVKALDEAVQASLAELGRWLPWAAGGYDRSVAQQFVRDSVQSWAEAKAYDFVIRRPADPDRHLGNVSVWYTSRAGPVGEVGYWVRTDEAGRGIATEAVAGILEAAFEEVGMHRVVLRIAVGNRGSERIAEKLGFVQEGLLREEVQVAGKWLDHTIWGLLDHEWRVLRSRYVEAGWT